MISIRNIHKSFGTQVVLDGINIEIEDGETLAIVGPSGTGKSVLIKIITGLLEADAGEVEVNGELITSAQTEDERNKIRESMGILFQSAALFDSLSVFENVAFPLRYRFKLPEIELEKRVLQRIEEVGMRGYELAMPGEISIGMRKRIGIARALVSNPSILLFDEPNTGLDPLRGQEIYELIRDTQKASGFTGIVISHEIPEVFQICRRVVMLHKGRVQLDDSADEFSKSQLPVVKQFREGSKEGPISLS